MIDSVPEADGIKQLRDGVAQVILDTTKSGDWPIRKRGYYRALKRQEPWAIDLSGRGPVQWGLQWIFGRPSVQETMRQMLNMPNPFFAMLPKDNLSFGGGHFPIPGVFNGTKNDGQ